MTTNQAVNNAIRVLLYNNKKVVSNKWQAQDVNQEMLELTNIFLTMDMVSNPTDLGLQTGCDLPWSEDHFQERIANDPEARNPGREWKNWPYYQHGKDDNRFRGDGFFSHTYQERFYPEAGCGRFPNGTLADVIFRLITDKTSRQAYLAIWHPEDQSNHNQRVPCTLGYWFKVNDGKLDMTYLIRSCDARRHFRNDVYMAQRLAKYVADKLGIEIGILTMWIGSFHCFSSDAYSLEQKLKKCADL